MANDMLNGKKKPLNDSDDDKSKARINTKNKMLEDILMIQSQFNQSIIKFISSSTRQKPSRIRRKERRQNLFQEGEKNVATPPDILRLDTPSLLISSSPSTLADMPSLVMSPSQVTETRFPAAQQACKIPGQDNADRVARPVTRIAILDNRKVAKPATLSELDFIRIKKDLELDVKILKIQNKEKEFQNKEKDRKIDALNT